MRSNIFSKNNQKISILVDRDGTIIKNVPYLNNLEEVIFFEDLIHVFKRFKNKLQIIVVSNQSGVGRGLVTHRDLHRIHEYIRDHYLANEIEISGFFYCPHLPDEGCQCRKPRTGLLQAAFSEFNLDFTNLAMIGDSEADQLAAKAMNISFYLVDQNRKYDFKLIEFIFNHINSVESRLDERRKHF